MVLIALGLLGALVGMALLNGFTAIRLEKAPVLESSLIVSLLIPLRNERSRLSQLLQSLEKLNVPFLEIILLDDESEDGTFEELQKINTPKFLLLKGMPLPEGWVGKNWACHQLSEKAKGDILVFCDADVAIGEKAIERTVSWIETLKVDALTALPFQKMESISEKSIIPFVMHLPVLGLLPLRWLCQLRRPSMVVANGQWLAIKKQSYHACGGHESVKNVIIEDMALGRNLVRNGFSLLPVLATHDLKVRMYESFESLVEGFTKNLFLLTGGNYFSWLLVFLMSVLVYLGPLWAGGVSLVLLVLFRVITAYVFEAPLLTIVLHPLGALGFLALLVKSLRAHLGHQVVWKGRNLKGSLTHRISIR